MENKSSDKTYEFSLDSAAVNGVSLPTFLDLLGGLSVDLAPGEKRNEEIRFSDWDFNYNDIGGYTDIELVFRVREIDKNGKKGADVLEAKTVHIYPYGEDKAAEFAREAQPSDKVILDNEYATVIFAGEANEKLKKQFLHRGYYCFEMFVINKTDKRLYFLDAYDSLSVNGQEEIGTGAWNTVVDGGKCSFGKMLFSKKDLKKNGIKNYEDFEEIKFKLEIYDSYIDDYGFHNVVWWGIPVAEHEITLNP